jgi:hypothetical protein
MSAKKDQEKQLVLSTKVPESTVVKLDRMAWDDHTTRSQVVKAAVDRYIETRSAKERR